VNEKIITQEERDLWRFEAAGECGTPSEEDERILRLLKALEAAEASIKEISDRLYKAGAISVGCSARAEKAEAELSVVLQSMVFIAAEFDCPASNEATIIDAIHAFKGKYKEAERLVKEAKEMNKQCRKSALDWRESADTMRALAGKETSRAEQAEAQVARLTAERDWLAKVCAMHCRDKSTDDSQCNISDCAPVHCRHASADQWKEAARKSVEGK